MTSSAGRWRCRATRWWSGRYDEDSNATGVNGNQSDNSAVGSGAAYVFVRNGTTWSQQAYLKASNTDAGDEFGTQWRCRATRWWSGRMMEDSNATGVNGNQSDNSASSCRRGLCLRAQRHDLEPAGLSQSLQHGG